MNEPRPRSGTGPRVGSRAVDITRRIRDLVRADIVAGAFVDGLLPSEEALRDEYAAPRSCVRDALTMLQAEGLVTRVRGRGTMVAAPRVVTSLRDLHGVDGATPRGVFDNRMHTRVVEWSSVPAPPPVVRQLGVVADEPVLRVEYVGYFGETVLGSATNYVRFPEAARLRREMLDVDWYAMLALGGLGVGETTFRIDGAIADQQDAALLGVAAGSAIFVMEQLIRDVDGRPFDLAFLRSCAEKTSYLSRDGYQSGG